MWGWYAERFDAMFANHLVRRHREFLRSNRDRMIAAVYANSNLGTQENAEARDQMLDSINDAYDRAVEILYGEPGAEQESSDPVLEEMESDPLFSSFFRQARVDTTISIPEQGAGAALLK